MSKTQYKLVSQNIHNGEVRDINITSEDFDDEEAVAIFQGNSLAQIDLFTSQFVHEEEMKRRLFEQGRISSMDDNVFIVYQDKQHRLSYYDLVFNRGINDDTKKLREVAKSYLAKGEVSHLDGLRIIRSFVDNVNVNSGFRSFVYSGCTGIYDKFLKAILGGNYSSFSRQLSDNKVGWATHSYSLLRNLVEAKNRYQKLSMLSADAVNNAKKIRDYQSALRETAKDDLILITDGASSYGQMSLFSFMAPPKVVPEPVKLSKKKGKIELLHDDYVDRNEKVRYVLSTIHKLQGRVFSRERGQKFDVRVFPNIEIPEEDIRAFNGLIDSSTKTYISEYLGYLSTKRENDKVGYYSYALSENMSSVWDTICRRVHRRDVLDGAYAWSKLYNRYVEANQKGDSYGKVYQKQ